MTELQRLEKAVVITKAGYEYAVFMFRAAGYDDNYSENILWNTTYTAWAEARLELSDYLKEHGDAKEV